MQTALQFVCAHLNFKELCVCKSVCKQLYKYVERSHVQYQNNDLLVKASFETIQRWRKARNYKTIKGATFTLQAKHILEDVLKCHVPKVQGPLLHFQFSRFAGDENLFFLLNNSTTPGLYARLLIPVASFSDFQVPSGFDLIHKKQESNVIQGRDYITLVLHRKCLKVHPISDIMRCARLERYKQSDNGTISEQERIQLGNAFAECWLSERQTMSYFVDWSVVPRQVYAFGEGTGNVVYYEHLVSYFQCIEFMKMKHAFVENVTLVDFSKNEVSYISLKFDNMLSTSSFYDAFTTAQLVEKQRKLEKRQRKFEENRSHDERNRQKNVRM